MGKMILAVAAGLLVGAFSVRCEAVTFKGNEDVCENLGETAFDVSQMRDAGVSWDVFQPWISTQLAAAKGDSRSYIKDDSDVEYVLKSFKRIYDDPQLTPEIASAQINNDCMKTKAGFKMVRGGGHRAPSKGKKT